MTRAKSIFLFSLLLFSLSSTYGCYCVRVCHTHIYKHTSHSMNKLNFVIGIGYKKHCLQLHLFQGNQVLGLLISYKTVSMTSWTFFFPPSCSGKPIFNRFVKTWLNQISQYTLHILQWISDGLHFPANKNFMTDLFKPGFVAI